jgi:proteasome accessory factor C
MLVVVPYLVQHPGTRLDDAAELFDITPDQLRRDLTLLMMSGVPPYGPGDLIDVDIDEEDEIWIRMADHFSRPVRLTRAEAIAVRVRAAELMATPGVPEAPDLASALAKLDAALGPAPIEASAAAGGPPLLERVRAAVDDRERLSLTYVAASSGERTERTVDPEVLFADLGNWYLVVWDLGVDDERMLRVDRIVEVSATGETFEPRGLTGAGRELYRADADDIEVRLRLSREARWVAEYYATTGVTELDDGWIEVVVPTKDPGWVASLLLRLGDDARVVEPSELDERRRDLARRALARYPEPGS